MAGEKGFWCGVYPVDPNTGNAVEFLFCSVNRPSATTLFGSSARTAYPYLETNPVVEISVFEGEFNGEASSRLSNLDLSATNSVVSSFPNYVWDGAKIVVWKGPADASTPAQLTQIFEGVIDGSPDNDGRVAKLSTKDKSYILDTNFLSATYAGTGGIEGPAELQGVYKPVIIGNPLNVQPMLINAPYVIFNYHGVNQQCSALSTVYENGISFGPPSAVISWQGTAAATYEALRTYSLTLGQWADAPSIGCFRLGGEPKSNGIITCDPARSDVLTLKETLIYLLGIAGVTNYDNTNLNNLMTACYNQTVHDFITDQTNVSDLIKKYMSDVGGYLFWSRTGAPMFGLVRMATPTATIDTNGRTAPVVLDIKSSPVSAPFMRLRMGADKVFKVHELSEISDALIQNVNALNNSLTTVSNTVYAASNDQILTPQEKIQVVIPGNTTMESAYTTISARATALSIDITALNAARTAYITARDSLSPAWNNTAVNSSLSGVTSPSFRDRVVNYNSALIAVNKLISEKDATLADWQQVTGTGKPQDNATRNAFQGNYSAAITYQVGDTVVWPVASGGTGSGYTRIGTGNTTGVAPSDTSKWAIFVERGATGNTGATGAAGSNNALVFLYQRAASAPTLPSANITYTFGSGAMTGITNGWSATIPAGTNPLYVTAATASSTGSNDVITSAEWSTPVIMTQNGVNGADGLNSATVELFLRTTTSATPTVPTTGTATYTFATGGITGQPSGWTTSVPSSGGDYLWVIRAAAVAATATDTIANTEWSTPVVLAQNGATGATGSPGTNGTSAVSGYITNEAMSVFAYADGSVVSYTGATGEFKIFSGNTDISSNFTLSTVLNPQSLTISYSGRTYTVTSGLDPSEDTASVTIRATGGGAYAGVTLDKVFTLAKTKGGYEIVNTLPTTNLFDGRVVYLTIDKKLYRYNGTGWTKEVDGGDLSAGSVTAAKINVTNLQAISATIGLLRTATSGQRLEIESNQIRVYDASNVLRVRMGIW